MFLERLVKFYSRLGACARSCSFLLVCPALVDLVDVLLIEEDEEDSVVPEAGEPVGRGHVHQKAEHVVDHLVAFERGPKSRDTNKVSINIMV